MSDREGEPLYCLCKKPYDDTIFMIECDVCKDWFHGECVNVEERQAPDIDTYHCPNCQLTHGPLKLRRKRTRKKHVADYSDDLDDLHDVKCGSISFSKALKQRHFPSHDGVIKKIKGHILDKEYVEENGFSHPILVKDSAGLDLRVPGYHFTVDDVELAVGSMRQVDVIDVAKQSDMKMLMREFVEYYNNPRKEKILNVISLEFSNTKLAEMVSPPRIVNDLSWVSNYWPESTGDVRTFIRPEVQKYCLMSVKDSYTDFHIDFGGTSVWYHIIKGQKVFYLIEPSDTNLALYETWSSSSDQNNIFFGDQVKACYKVVLKPGYTLFIPTGWIHGVYTPEDSLVFGGNFVHDYNIGLQLEIYEMERRLGTPDKFSFPNMETLYWYAAKNLRDRFQEALDGGKQLCKQILDGCTALKHKLHSWMHEKDQRISSVLMVKRHKDYIPEGISHVKLLKDLAYLLSQLTAQVSPSKTARREISQPKHANSNKVRKRQAPLKVKAKKRHSRSSSRREEEELSDVDGKPEQKELRKEETTTHLKPSNSSNSFSTDFSASSDRATLLGLKFKLNRTQASIKVEPEPANDSDLSEESESATDDVVVDDQPDKPADSIKKYRFSLGGRNIDDLTSASEDLLNSDNRSPEKQAPPTSSQGVTWSSGIEMLIKATTSLDRLENSGSTLTGSHRKERLGTKLSSAVIPTHNNSWSEKSREENSPQSSAPEPKSSNDSDDDTMEKRLKSCYTDDTYIYPALEDSDYEDSSMPPKKRKKTLRDQSWVPKSRANVIGREKRPSREHAIKPSVKAELEMTREYLKDRPDNSSYKLKRTHNKKTVTGNGERKSAASADDSAYTADLVISIPSTSMDHGYHLPVPNHVDPGKPRIKRAAGSTTKQRLGKLLKIHKMF